MQRLLETVIEAARPQRRRVRFGRGGSVSPRDLAAAKALLRRFRPVTAAAPLVRLGGDADGGYLVPDDFDGLVAGFSPGVDDKVSFDLDLAARGIPSFLMDGSVEGLPVSHPLLRFESAWLGAKTGRDTVSLEDWVQQKVPEQGGLRLQMDIEGAEYAALAATPDAMLRRFRMIVIEFHQFHEVFDRRWRARVMPALEKLERHFVPVHLHHNNHAVLWEAQGMTFPRVFEVTYLRRDRGFEDRVPVLPHPLDQPNVPEMPDVAVPAFWDV